jgi:hypothetical protein
MKNEKLIDFRIHKKQEAFIWTTGLSQRLELIDSILFALLLDITHPMPRRESSTTSMRETAVSEILSLNQIVSDLYFQGVIDDFSLVKNITQLKNLMFESLRYFSRRHFHSYLCALIITRSTLTLLRYRLHFIDLSYKGKCVLHWLSYFKIVSHPDMMNSAIHWKQITIVTQRSQLEIEDLYLFLLIEKPSLQQETLHALDRMSYLLQEIKVASFYYHKLQLLDCCNEMNVEMEVIHENVCKK